MIIQRLLRGVSPVLEVPFHDDESVDYDGFSEVVAHSLGTGVTSVMFPGFASEFHKLAADERQLLRGRLLDQTRSRNDVAAIVAVQDHATIVAVRRAVEAVADGADAINLLPPYLLGPSRSAVRAHVRVVFVGRSPHTGRIAIRASSDGHQPGRRDDRFDRRRSHQPGGRQGRVNSSWRAHRSSGRRHAVAARFRWLRRAATAGCAAARCGRGTARLLVHRALCPSLAALGSQ